MNTLAKLKFTKEGDFAPFAGNTVVANLYDQPHLLTIVDQLQTAYRELPFSEKLTLTPPESIHMTVFELLCDQNRQPEFWSKVLPLDIPIADVHAYFAEKLSHFPLTGEHIKMTVQGLGRQCILLKPADKASQERLDNIRDFISYQTGVVFPNHHNYQFHITFGYIREELTDEEVEFLAACRKDLEKTILSKLTEVAISRIDYTTFESMARFTPYGQ